MKDTPKPDNHRKYDAAFRAEALRLAEQSRSTQAAARALNIDPKCLYQWQKAAQTPVAAALGAALDPATAAKLRQLRAANRRQAQELEIFKKSHRQQTLEARYLTDAGPMSRYRFINTERGHYPVRRLCQVLGVPASGYDAWQTGQQRAVDQQTPAWETALIKTFGHHQRRYGTRRLQVALRQDGHAVGRQRLRTAMRRRGLRALQPKAFTPRTTDSTHSLRCAPNRLLDQPKPTRANQVWVSDITYLPLTNGNWVVPGRAYLYAF